jgi:uncharacterized protein (TIGR03435 family)
MNPLQRRIYTRIYSSVLRLHPLAFRDEFGREMERDFDDALGERGFAPLLGDAFLSVARQWRTRAFAAPEMAQPTPSRPLLAGQYLAVDRGSSLTAFDLARAALLSLLLVLTIGFAAGIPNRRVIADLQTVRVSHDGGIDTGGNNPPPAGNNDGRREASGAREPESTSSYGTALHGKGRVRLHPEATGWSLRPRTRVVWQAPSLADAVRQFAMISVVVWLTSFFLRCSPGIGRRMLLTALGLLGLAASVAFGAVPTPAMHAQILHPTEPLPSFEVTTVKLWQPRPMPLPPGSIDNRPPMPRKFDPMTGPGAGQRTDRVHLIGQTALLLQSAFNLSMGLENQIVGAPGWVGGEGLRYEVQAKIDDAQFAAMQKMTPAEQREQVALMEQSLLADRFKLKVHFETRELPAYTLVIAKGGAKLTPAKDGEVSMLSSLGDETTGTAVMLAQFVRSPLLRPDGRVVIDQTGLKGAYDFTIKGESGDDASSFFTLIQEQLGLKLVPTKAPVEVIVIDHIEKPSEN